MKSCQVILLVAGVVLTVSAHASSLTYQRFYDDDEYSQEDINPQQQPSSSYKDQDYYGDEVREGREEEQEQEQEQVVYDDVKEAADDDATGEFPHRVYDEVTPPTTPTHDPLDDDDRHYEDDVNLTSARRMAVLSIMDRLLIALDFREGLPKAPTNDTLATVPTPINFMAEPCPYKYKRCSSQTSFPLCEIPHNTDPEVWSQRFNLYFNLSADFDKLDIINATLRLYKNNSIPLHYPKPLLIKAYAYTRSLTRRRSRTMLVAETSVSSDYIGWVNMGVEKIVRRWRKARNNHGLLITVTDADTIPWDASSIFVTMSCSSGNNSLVPLPFEVQTDEVGQRYPALNVRQGSPDDEFPVAGVSRVTPSPRPAIQTEVVSGYIQADDPDVYDDEYDIPQSSSHRQSSFPGSHSAAIQNNYPHGHPVNPHNNHPHTAGSHRSPLPNNYPYGTDLIREDLAQGSGHALRSGLEHTARGISGHDSAYPHGAPAHDIPIDYLITNQATNNHHSSNPQYGSGASHTRNLDHSVRGHVEHQIDRMHTTQSTIEDIIHSHNSEEQIRYGEWVPQRESNPPTEPSRPHRQRDSGNAKERRHRRKHHHQHSRRAEERHGSAASAL